MHVTHNKKKMLYYTYVLQNFPAIEYFVCGAQLWESIVCEIWFIREITEVEVGDRTMVEEMNGGATG
jgi:hypothetical protein